MIEIRNLTKTYRMGDNVVHALKGVNLSIAEGDYVAIMGPSGSGKSTLMQILGLLDVPSGGSYLLGGREVAGLSEDELAIVRREEIGFIFQQFNLLPRMTAAENVALPLLYSKKERGLDGARRLLNMVGLGSRGDHQPNELSGGQQQRVAIARSLINQPRLIFADEPTGNLDSKSEHDILAALKELNDQGITVVLVTHGEKVGQQAKRLIRMLDGEIKSDERNAPLPDLAKRAEAQRPFSVHEPEGFNQIGAPVESVTRQAAKSDFDFYEVGALFQQSLKTLWVNKARTFLSMLGILIGVAAVVAMLAIGAGAQKAVESQLTALGSNLLVLVPGNNRVGGIVQEGAVTRLTPKDTAAIRGLPNILAVSSTVNGRAQVTFKNKNWNTRIRGCSSTYAAMSNNEPAIGRFFTDDEDNRRARVAVLGATVARELFGEASPIGEMIKMNKVIFQVVGVLPEKGGSMQNQDDVIMIPAETAMRRLLGKKWVDSIDIQMSGPNVAEFVERQVLELVLQSKRVPPSRWESAFEVRNMADVQAALTETSRTMSLLLASIAAISLVVGGIGIMNIMLVSVTERTKEIGLRKAIGARRRDILLQFLIESVAVSAIGGISGILLGVVTTLLLGKFAGWATVIAPQSIFVSFFFSTAIGVAFGIYPARKASLRHPIEALRYE